MPFPLVVLLIGLLAGSATAAERHLVILSGQSNMDGLKAETDFRPEITRLLPGAGIVLVQDDERAQPLRRWLREWPEIAAKHGFTDKAAPKHPDGELYDRLLTAVRAAAADGTFASVTLVWMQGESDAMLKGYAPVYRDAFHAFVTKLKADLKLAQLNVVIGRLSDFQGADKPDWTLLRETQVAYARENRNSAWVDTDDLNDKERNGKAINDLHYTQDGYRLLGMRFARQTARLITGKAPAADGRPE